MTKVKDIDIKMDNGLYAGQASLCQIKYHQLAGFKPRVHRKPMKVSPPSMPGW